MVTTVACHPADDIVRIGYEEAMILGARFADSKGSPVGAPGQWRDHRHGLEQERRQLVLDRRRADCGVVDIAG